MIKPTITDVFFGLDHTLWDFDRNSALAMERVFQTFTVSVPLEAFLKIYEPINFDYWKSFREELVTKQELRRGRLIDSFNVFNIQYDMDTIDDVFYTHLTLQTNRD